LKTLLLVHRIHADMRRGSGKRLCTDGSKDAQTSSDEESEAEVEEEVAADRTTAPVASAQVPKWEALAGNRAVWDQLC
jgi:hypothetical protein